MKPIEATYAQLEQEAEEIRARINRLRKSVGRFLVDKQHLIDLMVTAAVAQEPLLLVGPPGTAKSDLILKFKDAIGIRDEDYFEYMLTRFTEPSESSGRSTSINCAKADTFDASKASYPRRDWRFWMKSSSPIRLS